MNRQKAVTNSAGASGVDVLGIDPDIVGKRSSRAPQNCNPFRAFYVGHMDYMGDILAAKPPIF